MNYLDAGNRIYVYHAGKLHRALITGPCDGLTVWVLLEHTTETIEVFARDTFPDLGDDTFISFPMECLDDEEREWLRDQLRHLAKDAETPPKLKDEHDEEREWLRDLIGRPARGLDYHGPRQLKRNQGDSSG